MSGFCENNEVSRFAPLEGTINDFTGEQGNRNTREKTDRDVSGLLKTIPQRNVELRNVDEIPHTS